MSDVLTAIDEALDTGTATNDDPLTRELQELALELRADSPEPTPVYRDWLTKQVDAGFPKKKRSRPSWTKLMKPGLATGLIALPLVLVVVLALGNPDSDQAESGGSGGSDGGGGAAAEPMPSPDAGSMEIPQAALDARRGSAESADDFAAGGSAPAVVLPPADRGFAPGRSQRKIERTVGLELEMPLDEMARVAEQVTAVTNRHGGFVLTSSVSTGEDAAGGDFELRIPSNRLRPALRDLAALADVRTQSQSGRDVTREHVTATDRLQAARAERRSLLRRLEVASTDEEAEAIRRRLDLVAGEINGLRSQLRALRLRTDYAVVTVSLLPQDGGDEGGGAGGSFDDALGDAGDLLVGVAGIAVRAIAVALPLALIALMGWLATRTFRRRQRESALA